MLLHRALPLASVVLVLAGCPNQDLKPLVPCTLTGVSREVSVDRVEKVDLLFVVDNSGSMTEEQASLADQIPRLVNVLATGDRDLDGEPDFPAVRSLNVGVITTDMGTGGFRVATCAEPNFGDDGLLQTTASGAGGCMATYPPVLNCFEFLCIVERDGGLVYTAMPNGRQPATDFVLTSLTDDTATFENPTHDFPKKIQYVRKADGSMEAVVSGAANRKPQVFQFKKQ